MKPINYYGNKPLKFAPFEAVSTFHEIPVKAHPAITRIRNKRKRMRAIKLMARRGVRTFLRPVWEIYPPNEKSPSTGETD
jgi:hypothetical protein